MRERDRQTDRQRKKEKITHPEFSLPLFTAINPSPAPHPKGNFLYLNMLDSDYKNGFLPTDSTLNQDVTTPKGMAHRYTQTVTRTLSQTHTHTHMCSPPLAIE